jgi:glutamyl-Q tRNA(Asp) synthetase
MTAELKVNRGRFAPTPSGPLHFGSLVAAVASYCQARAHHAEWLMRIEDVDTPRVVDGAADRILLDLELFGFEWDGPVIWQSTRFDRYRHHLDRLLAQGACYACECSRRNLREQGVASGPLGQIYPGNCRGKNLPADGHSIRLDTRAAGRVGFEDLVYAHCELDLTREVGDFVLRRADSIYAYHLAVVVDDAEQGIGEVVRGADLLEITCLHVFLQRQLGFETPRYLHVPLVNNTDGIKLSKQTGAAAVDPSQASQQLVDALAHLGQQTETELASAWPAEVLRWGIEHWNPMRIPAYRAAHAEDVDA